MPQLDDFFAGRFDRYFEEIRAQEKLWLFVHVPKTAGSSLIAEAEAILKPAYNIDIDHTDTTHSYQARFDQAVRDFVAKKSVTNYRFCTGHITARHVGMIADSVADVNCFSFLRNPVARIVSDYRYQRSAMNTAQAAFLETTPDFATYIDRPHVHNKMALHLVPRLLAQGGNAAHCVEYIDHTYMFIGAQEMYPLSLRALTTLMGRPRLPRARVRVNKSTSDSLDLDEDMIKRLHALNATDMGIFRTYIHRLRAIREPLRAFLQRYPVEMGQG